MSLTPKNRKEEWLEGFVQHETTLTPKNREEAWAKEIIDASGGGGTGGGVLAVQVTFGDESAVMDKTLKEIWDSLPNGAISFYGDNGDSLDFYAFVSIANGGLKSVAIYDYIEQARMDFVAATENDYPTYVYN